MDQADRGYAARRRPGPKWTVLHLEGGPGLRPARIRYPQGHAEHRGAAGQAVPPRRPDRVGWFATVFRARDLRLDRDVAVKVLLANHATDPVLAARFDREARVLAAVSHPNVVAIHDVAPGDPATGGEPFLVMDLCNGGSLAGTSERDRTDGAGAGTVSRLPGLAYPGRRCTFSGAASRWTAFSPTRPSTWARTTAPTSTTSTPRTTP